MVTFPIYSFKLTLGFLGVGRHNITQSEVGLSLSYGDEDRSDGSIEERGISGRTDIKQRDGQGGRTGSSVGSLRQRQRKGGNSEGKVYIRGDTCPQMETECIKKEKEREREICIVEQS